VTPTVVAAAYQRSLEANGELVTLKRQGDSGSYQAWARVTDFVPEDLVGAVEEGRRTAIVSAADIVAGGFPLPLKPNQDTLVWGSTTNVITKVDNATVRVQGVLVAYKLELSGA